MLRPILLAWSLLALAANDVLAQGRPSPLADLAVDHVALKSGPQLRGSVVGRNPQGQVLMAVARQWLREEYPTYYRKTLGNEANSVRESYRSLLRRTRQWLAEIPENDRTRELRVFLGGEIERIADTLTDLNGQNALDTQFVFSEFPPGAVKYAFAQPPERKRIALLAWREELPGVETRQAADLAEELRRREVAPDDDVDLSDRAPPREQDERQWAARQAIVEHEFAKRLEFQGTSQAIFRTDEDAKEPDVSQVVGQMLNGRLQRALGEMLGGRKPQPKNDWLDPAIAAAQREGVRGIRVTRLDQDPTAGRVTVEDRFVARMPDGSFETVLLTTASLGVDDTDAETVGLLAEDPRVKKAVETVQGLGLPVADERLQAALRFGAATMEAQRQASVRFFDLRRRYSQRLEGPPLLW